jgi:hypothetical protein
MSYDIAMYFLTLHISYDFLVMLRISSYKIYQILRYVLTLVNFMSNYFLHSLQYCPAAYLSHSKYLQFTACYCQYWKTCRLLLK